jgi:Metal-dependent hydrolases of the beta-lactamase superfamily I
MARFTTLYSGSSGNCAVIEEDGGYILVDMGKSCRWTTKALYEAGLSISNLRGICVTHEHTDHVSGLEVFLRHNNVPLYGGPETLEYLEDRNLVPGTARLFTIENSPVEAGGFLVEAFDTSHDAVGCKGYRITTPKGKVVSVATDLGYVSNAVFNGLNGADLVALEANYDKGMLMTGPYPYYLKTRIASSTGHLGNIESAETLLKLLKEGCNKFALCHMSKENNTREIVLNTMQTTFMEENAKMGEDCLMQLSLRNEISPFIEV